MENTTNGFQVDMDDAPNGAAPYSITIAIPIRIAVVGKPTGESVGANQVATQQTESSSPRFWTVVLSAVVDGSEMFTFSKDEVTHQHKSWGPPTNVLFNGKPWVHLERTPDKWTEHRGKLDLTRAWVVRRSGRDCVAMEKITNGFRVYMADAPNGAAPYSITIAIPLTTGEADK